MPPSRPGPLYEYTEDLFALSQLALKINGIFSLLVTSTYFSQH